MRQLEKLIEELIKFQTVEGNAEQFEKCLNYIENRLSNNFRFERFEKEEEKSLLISRGENPRILLHGHIDVVEADEELFRPETRNGKLYGRGAADMKSGVACMMKVLEETETEEVALLLTSDEERGGFNGTGYVIEEKNLNPEFVISAEPDDSGSYPSIVTAQKGVLQVKISTEGKSAHASKPEKGENAAEKLIEKYKEIRSLFNHEKDFGTTVNLGRMSSEGPVNKIPCSASLQLDIRHSSGYPAEEVLDDLREISEINVEVKARAPMLSNSEDEEIINDLRNAAQDLTGDKVDFRKENFASDMRFFTEKKIPAVCFGPEGYDLHGENEHVEVDSLSEYCEILKNLLERVEL